jgi:hypothetical protein
LCFFALFSWGNIIFYNGAGKETGKRMEAGIAFPLDAVSEGDVHCIVGELVH